MIPILAHLRFEAAVLVAGYLVWGWRGAGIALVVREAIPLILRLFLR